MTVRDTTTTDIRRRQREIADRILADAGTNGVDRAEINQAFAAAGVSVIENRGRVDRVAR